MRHLPDGDYKWILHAIDHWSKFNFAFPLKSKDAESVAAKLKSFIFPYFGMPKIFHSDNGGEFVNHVVENLISLGMRTLCRNNFRNNRMQKESGIMLE